LQSPNTDISAGVGNTNSKTPQGVNMSGAILSVDDNYVRKQFEQWYERWSETAINLYFAERTGIEELQLDEETADALSKLDGFDPSRLSPDGKIRINYDTDTPILHFYVDPSSSQMKDDPQQLASITNLIGMVAKFPQLNKRWGGTIILDELSRRLVRASALQDPEQIAPEATKAEKQAQLQNNKPNGFSPLFDKPKISISWEQLDPVSQQQVLALAGVNVQLSDIMKGPIANINARGNAQLTPQDDPNQLYPAGQPGQGQPPTQAPTPPPIAAQVTPDHVLKAIDQDHQHQLDNTKMALEIHKANNPTPQPTPVSAPGKPAPKPAAQPVPFVPPTQPTPSSPAPQGAQPLAPQGITPADQPIIQALQHAGANPQQIGQALAMLHHGFNEQQIMQMLKQGAPNGR
jgi:hypothetical protein